MSTKRDDLDKNIAYVEGAFATFEKDNPWLAEAIETLGMTIDEYDRIMSEMPRFEIETSNSSS